MEAVRHQIEQWLEPKLKETGLFLVDVKWLPGNKVQVFIDSEGGITIDQCAEVSRYLERYLDSDKIIGERYTLEVSSPGIDQPFRVLKQYVKNIGKEVEVLLYNGIKKQGVLLKADDRAILVEEQRGKEKIQLQMTLNEIKNTKIHLKF